MRRAARPLPPTASRGRFFRAATSAAVSCLRAPIVCLASDGRRAHNGAGRRQAWLARAHLPKQIHFSPHCQRQQLAPLGRLAPAEARHFRRQPKLGARLTWRRRIRAQDGWTGARARIRYSPKLPGHVRNFSLPPALAQPLSHSSLPPASHSRRLQWFQFLTRLPCEPTTTTTTTTTIIV